jgi:hypothetical protein
MITAQQLAAALRAAANSLDGGNVSEVTAPAVNLAPLPPPPQQQTNAPTVTAEQITALIQPHVGNEAIKAALGVAMRAMGINALPEAQPHQYAALHQAFQGVLAAHGVGGPAPNLGGGGSII